MTSNNSDVKPLTSAFDSPYFGEDTSFHIDQAIGSMSISPCGRDVVLASKEGLQIIDLDSPYSPPRYLPHHTSWEVADVQWSPFAIREQWIVSTSNQKALVWNVGAKSWQDYVEFVLHGHSRAITDINFSAHHPDVLATCAVDSFVHCWDLRTPHRPVISFSDWFAGATQVKWNRQNPHVVASSHDKYLRIWDDRMGAHPVRSIEAHNTKIYGVDWNRHQENKIVTCSLDKTIKFWDTSVSEDVPQRVIETGFPVWRARHTPFGWGLLAMPQRGNSDLHLYDRRETESLDPAHGDSNPVAAFPGHRGQVKEFLWRSRGTIENSVDHREFQLVTWGTDRQLRLHRVEAETMLGVGYEKDVSIVPKLNLTRKGAPYKTFRDEPSDESTESPGSQLGIPTGSGQHIQIKPRGSTGMGMRKVTLPLARGWMQGQGVHARIGMHGKSSMRQNTNPIAWMKNVKILSEELETLSEEVTQVGESLPKVSFEVVDIPHRKATIALHGPWGPENMPVFLKIDMKFPKDYPRAAPPVFTVQKTASMTDELSKRISADMKSIAEAYVKIQHGCIEAALRYLLREQGADEIIAMVKDEEEDHAGLSGSVLVGDISSDEDDEDVGDFQGQAGLTSSEVLNQNVLVPVAKACGALWSDSGKLVCFFPPKPKEPPSFLDALSSVEADKSRSEKIFEGFGRFHTASPGPRGTVGTATTNDDPGSDDSDEYLSSSSSSSSSSSGLGNEELLPLNAWRTGGLRRSRSHENSQRSTTGGLSASKTTLIPATNIVSIHQLGDLIPPKRELATEYTIYGNGSTVCNHNADVALKHGYMELARVWGLVKLILSDEVPYETMFEAESGSNMNVVAQSALSKLRRKDSGIDLGEQTSKSELVQKARVRWGSHAFGGQWLIPKLFEHFETVADIQMLAMLSCVFHEPTMKNDDSASRKMPEQPPAPFQTPAFAVNYFPSKEIAYSLVGQKSAPQMTRMMSMAGSRSTGPPTTDVSFSSSAEQPVSDVAVPASTGSTPPAIHSAAVDQLRRSSHRMSFDSRERDRAGLLPIQTPTLSTSPEGIRVGRRTNSNLAPSSESRANMHGLTRGYSGSPPTNILEGGKKPSPASSFTSRSTAVMSSAAGWASPMFLGGHHGSGKVPNIAIGPNNDYQHSLLPQSAAHSSYLSQSYSEADLEGDGRRDSSFIFQQNRPSPTKSSHSSTTKVVGSKSTRRRVKISVTLHNQNLFDNDGYATIPLQDPAQEGKFRAYRAQYANLLSVWGLHVQRCEIQKIDHLGDFDVIDGAPARIRGSDASDATASRDHRPTRQTLDSMTTANGLLAGTSRKRPRDLITSHPDIDSAGLDIQKHCLRCGVQLSPIQENGLTIAWECTTCPRELKGTGKLIFCSICDEVIYGSMVPCLNCGHVTCFPCARQWFGMARNKKHSSSGYQEGDQSCPTGCGCVCTQHEKMSVNWPSADPEGAIDDDLASSDAGTEILSITPSSMNLNGPGTAGPLSPLAEDSRENVVDGAGAAGVGTGASAGAGLRVSASAGIAGDDTDEWEDESEDDGLTDDAIWGNSQLAGLGRGMGGGLSRGLRSQGSGETIRRAD